MDSLINQILALESSPINKMVEKRLKQFSSFSSKTSEDWFSELCFCILAANSKQKTAETIEKFLGHEKLLTVPQKQLAKHIRDNKHRFHNNKSKYIVEARRHHPIKNNLTGDEFENRIWLVNNVKGIGMKEASHFLRNTGTKSLAILDRHILRTMRERGLINEIPASLGKKDYLDIETKFVGLAKKLNMSPAKLDLFMWYMKTGEVKK